MALRARYINRPWRAVATDMEKEGFDRVDVRKDQHGRTYRYLLRKDVLAPRNGPTLDLLAEFTTFAGKPGTGPDAEATVTAAACLQGNIGVLYEKTAWERWYGRGTVLPVLLEHENVRKAAAEFPIVDTIRISYDLIRDHRAEYLSYGFHLHIVFIKRPNDDSAGKQLFLSVASRLDPPESWDGRRSLDGFKQADALGEVRVGGSTEWRGTSGPTVGHSESLPAGAQADPGRAARGEVANLYVDFWHWGSFELHGPKDVRVERGEASRARLEQALARYRGERGLFTVMLDKRVAPKGEDGDWKKLVRLLLVHNFRRVIVRQAASTAPPPVVFDSAQDQVVLPNRQRTIAFTGVVRSITYIEQVAERDVVVPVHVDPRFALTVSVDSVDLYKAPQHPIRAGSRVTLAIHSPTKLFADRAENVVGKTYDFTVAWHAGPPAWFSGLAVRRLRDRREFARLMARVKEGMPKRKVVALLGKPDDVVTARDPDAITTARTKEILSYGTDGHLTFPTLGCVYIDTRDRVQYVFGGRGKPPAATLLGEPDLRALLRLLSTAPRISGVAYDPWAVVRIVNALHPLGKERSLAAISEYLRVSSHWHSEREGLFLVLRALFEVPPDPGYMPRMHIGGPSPREPKDRKLLPRFPQIIRGDVPLLMVWGYALGGEAQRVEEHVDYFRKHGTLRAEPLSPTPEPMKLLGEIESSPQWFYPPQWSRRARDLIRGQLMRFVESRRAAEAGTVGSR
ncbi:MAG: hypothetical protein ACYS9X_07520 [Planctomycetota bacterium]